MVIWSYMTVLGLHEKADADRDGYGIRTKMKMLWRCRCSLLALIVSPRTKTKFLIDCVLVIANKCTLRAKASLTKFQSNIQV